MAGGDNFKLSIISQFNPSVTQIVADYGYTDNSGGSLHLDTGDIITSFRTMVETKYRAVLPDCVFIHQYRCQCVASTHGFKGEIGYYDLNPTVAGTNGSETLPPEMAISIRRKTGWASRRDRGRLFLGPVTTSYFSSATPDVVQVDATLLTFAGTVSESITVSGVVLSPVILSANGTYSGHLIIANSVPNGWVHRKSRRAGVGS